mmetsp:Transcript_77907/g.174659  ORF Transcript_77907/g.174659 Transcript_77907/m.174659 type:complete len:204 (+) Transcript_77907:834-1445(+)
MGVSTPATLCGARTTRGRASIGASAGTSSTSAARGSATRFACACGPMAAPSMLIGLWSMRLLWTQSPWSRRWRRRVRRRCVFMDNSLQRRARRSSHRALMTRPRSLRRVAPALPRLMSKSLPLNCTRRTWPLPLGSETRSTMWRWMRMVRRCHYVAAAACPLATLAMLPTRETTILSTASAWPRRSSMICGRRTRIASRRTRS